MFQIDACPFCTDELKMIQEDEFKSIWFCMNCRCEQDEDISRYEVIRFVENAEQMSFEVNDLYVRNVNDITQPENSRTIFYTLKGCLLTDHQEIPLVQWNLFDPTATQDKIKLLMTFL